MHRTNEIKFKLNLIPNVFKWDNFEKLKEKKAKIRNRYNQVTNLTWKTIWESSKRTQENITHKGDNRSF